MNRRSVRSLRVENFLYDYDTINSKWVSKNKFISEDLFKSGVFYSCKRMAQKVNPIGFRLKSQRFWDSSWCSMNNKYSMYVQEDLIIRMYIANVFNNLGYGISHFLLYRFHNKIFLNLVVFKFSFLPQQLLFISQDRALKIYDFFYKKFYRFFKKNRIFSTGKFFYNPLFKNTNNKDVIPTQFRNDSTNLLDKINFYIENEKILNCKDTISYMYLTKQFNMSEIQPDAEDSFKIYLQKRPLKSLLKDTLEKFSKNKVFISISDEPFILSNAATLLNIIVYELRFSRNSFRNILTNIFKDVTDLRNVKGIRVNCAGRLSKTTTMAQTDWFRIGQIPLTTLAANIDYAAGDAKTKNGLCGVKVWIFYK